MNEPYLGAGSKVGFDIGQTGTFKNLIGAEALPPVGTTAEAKTKTTVSDDRQKYGRGLNDSPDFSLTMQYNPQDADQQSFITALKQGKVMDLQYTLPTKENDDGTTTDVTLTFEFEPFGGTLDQVEGEEWLKYTVTGKQNTDAEETITNTPAS